jgi:hypothetical protein
METNNIKASRIKAAGNNLLYIGYTLIACVLISLIQVAYISGLDSGKSNYLESVKDSSNVFMILNIVFAIIIIFNMISAGNNLISCEERKSKAKAKADVIPNVDSEKLLLKLNMTKSNSGKLANGGIIVYADTNGLHGLVCSISDLGIGDWNSAKQLCDNYNEGGFSDWRLPTKDELQLIYFLLHRRKIGGFADGNYWSSTEANPSIAWGQYFYSGRQRSGSKSTKCSVRAVRAF